jgi:TPR repeat protein
MLTATAIIMKRALGLPVALLLSLGLRATGADFSAGLQAYRSGDYAAALREWMPLAEAGDAEAQFWVGQMFANGQGVPKDDVQMAAWFRRAAEQCCRDPRKADVDAAAILGTLYDLGRGVPRDYAQAARWTRVAAEAGDASSQNMLAYYYEEGTGVKQSDLDATRWYRAAAEQGLDQAQFSLGFDYEHGKGVPQNYVEASTWFRRAAEQGNRLGQSGLCTMYFGQEGLRRDYVQAYVWCSLAAAQGMKTPAAQRDLAASRMSRKDILRAQRLASEFAPKPTPETQKNHR